MRISLGLGGGEGQPLPSAWVLPASSTSLCRLFMVTLNSCHTVSAGAVQELIFAFFLLILGFPSLGMFVCRGRRGTGSRCFLKHHWLTFSCACPVSVAEIDP